MKTITSGGVIVGILYDKIHAVMAEDSDRHTKHECDEKCQPPSEADLIAWYRALPEKDRELVRFVTFLHGKKYALPITHWFTVPIEAIEVNDRRN